MESVELTVVWNMIEILRVLMEAGCRLSKAIICSICNEGQQSSILRGSSCSVKNNDEINRSWIIVNVCAFGDCGA